VSEFGVRVDTTVPAVDRKHPVVNMNEPLIPHNDAFFMGRNERDMKDFRAEKSGFRIRFRNAVAGRQHDDEG
jgi:hypothetical protein